MIVVQFLGYWTLASIWFAIPACLFFKAAKSRSQGQRRNAPSDRAHGGRVGSNNFHTEQLLHREH